VSTPLSHTINLSQIQTARICRTLRLYSLVSTSFTCRFVVVWYSESHLVGIVFKESGFSIYLLKDAFPQENIQIVRTNVVPSFASDIGNNRRHRYSTYLPSIRIDISFRDISTVIRE